MRIRSAEQVAFCTVLAVLAAGFGYLLVEPGRTGRSTGLIAAALLLAAVLRAVLPNALAGMLAVRGRVLDVLCYLAVGGVLLAIDLRLRG